MAVTPLQRPRNFSDVCDAIEQIDDTLQSFDKQIAKNTANGNVLATVVTNLATNVGSLIETLGKIPSTPPRDPEATLSGLEPDLQEYRQAIRQRVKDPTRFDSERARAEIRKAISDIRRDDNAARWDALIKLGKRIAIAVIIAYAIAVTLAHFGLKP